MLSPKPATKTLDPKSRSPGKVAATVPKAKINMVDGAGGRPNPRSGSQGRVSSAKSDRKNFKSPGRAGPQGADAPR